MAPCRACGEKLAAHTPTAAEKPPKPKKQPNPQTTMWHTKKYSTHIKRKNPILSASNKGRGVF
jgi:hypothetical protein